MKFSLYSSTSRLEAFLAFIVTTAQESPLALSREGRSSATISDISTKEMFNIFGTYREQYGDAAWDIMGESHPPTVVARTEVDGLTYSFIPQIRNDGHSVHLYVYGDRGQIVMEIASRSDYIPARGGRQPAWTQTFLYAKDAGNDPFFIENREGLAERVFTLWQTGDDDGVFSSLREFYERLTPQPGEMKPEYQRIVREIMAAVAAAGGAQLDESYPERVGLDPNNYKSAGGIRLLLNKGFPEVLSVPEGSYSLRNDYETIHHDDTDPNAGFDGSRFREILESSFDVRWSERQNERENCYIVLEIRER